MTLARVRALDREPHLVDEDPHPDPLLDLVRDPARGPEPHQDVLLPWKMPDEEDDDRLRVADHEPHLGLSGNEDDHLPLYLQLEVVGVEGDRLLRLLDEHRCRLVGICHLTRTRRGGVEVVRLQVGLWIDRGRDRGLGRERL